MILTPQAHEKTENLCKLGIFSLLRRSNIILKIENFPSSCGWLIPPAARSQRKTGSFDNSYFHPSSGFPSETTKLRHSLRSSDESDETDDEKKDQQILFLFLLLFWIIILIIFTDDVVRGFILIGFIKKTV